MSTQLNITKDESLLHSYTAKQNRQETRLPRLTSEHSDRPAINLTVLARAPYSQPDKLKIGPPQSKGLVEFNLQLAARIAKPKLELLMAVKEFYEKQSSFPATRSKQCGSIFIGWNSARVFPGAPPAAGFGSEEEQAARPTNRRQAARAFAARPRR